MSNLSQNISLLRTGVPLQHRWTFWLDKNISGVTDTDYEANLIPLHTVGTVQEFWYAYHSIGEPNETSSYKNLYFMKTGIKPLWEDAKNEKGGCLVLRIQKQDATVVWREMLMLLIGEQLDGCFDAEDEICGVFIGDRRHQTVIQLWNAKAHLFNQQLVLEKIKSVLNGIDIGMPHYKAHKEHQDFKHSNTS
jgi:hypothetical protein